MLKHDWWRYCSSSIDMFTMWKDYRFFIDPDGVRIRHIMMMLTTHMVDISGYYMQDVATFIPYYDWVVSNK